MPVFILCDYSNRKSIKNEFQSGVCCFCPTQIIIIEIVRNHKDSLALKKNAKQAYDFAKLLQHFLSSSHLNVVSIYMFDLKC